MTGASACATSTRWMSSNLVLREKEELQDFEVAVAALNPAVVVKGLEAAVQLALTNCTSLLPSSSVS